MAQQQPTAQLQMKPSLRALLIGAAVIAAPQMASASLSYDLTTISFNSAGSGTSYPTLSFAKFDTAGGAHTLTGVSLDWVVNSGISSATVTNESAGAVTIDRIDFTRTFSAMLGTDSLLYDLTGKQKSVSPAVVLNHGDSRNVTTFSFNQATSNDTYTSSLAAYLGVGNVNITLSNSITATPDITAGGGQTVSWLTTVTGSSNGTLGVTYSYELTPVPEPGSLLALGCLIGSGACLRLRRRA